MVQLDKLRLQTRAKEEEQALARGGKDPFIVVKNPSASKGGVAETSIKARLSSFLTVMKTNVFSVQVCTECEEEFCSGTCKDFQYDSYQVWSLKSSNFKLECFNLIFQRLIIEEKEKETAVDTQALTTGKGKKKKKGGKKKKGPTAADALSKMPVKF